jgi:hypothetical protein
MSASVLPDGGEVKDIELLKDEIGGLMMEEGITTITFYKGPFRPASEALRAQFVRVVTANPWLAGRLVKTKAGTRLRHPNRDASSAEIDSLFTVTSIEDAGAFKLDPTSPYTKICTDMYKSKKVVVQSGYATLGKNKPLTLLTVTESTPGEFALMFSMSHVIADGRTFYEIFKMLQPGAAVRELSCERFMTFSETMRDMCGRKEMKWADSPGTQFLYTFAMCGNSKAKCYAFHLDDKRVAAAKTEGATDGGVPYVTTNDILTSGFFNECRARIGMMGFDCRERIEGVKEDMAGNYVTALILDTEVFSTPATLRKMVSIVTVRCTIQPAYNHTTIHAYNHTPYTHHTLIHHVHHQYSSTPYETTKRPLPGCCCGNGRFAMVTNWSSFAGEMVQFEGCELVIHLPVHNPAACVYDLMIPFASGVGKRGVICWTVSTDENGLRDALPVGEGVSKVLFPDMG